MRAFILFLVFAFATMAAPLAQARVPAKAVLPEAARIAPGGRATQVVVGQAEVGAKWHASVTSRERDLAGLRLTSSIRLTLKSLRYRTTR